MDELADPQSKSPALESSATSDADLARVLAANMRAVARRAGLTKRTAARLALVKAIQSGVLRPGDRLPPETKLTGILGVSLGTVQAALRQLQLVGAIVRRRGDGSRVASAEPLGPSVWHFRFLSKATGAPLRITDERVEISRVSKTGDWSDYIGGRPAYVRIRRFIVLDDAIRAGAEMFLDAGLAPGLLDMNPNELDMINIRPYLQERFGIVTAGATHCARTVRLDARTASLFGLPSEVDCFEIEAKAYSNENLPVYFQRIFVSADACALTF